MRYLFIDEIFLSKNYFLDVVPIFQGQEGDLKFQIPCILYIFSKLNILANFDNYNHDRMKVAGVLPTVPVS